MARYGRRILSRAKWPARTRPKRRFSQIPDKTCWSPIAKRSRPARYDNLALLAPDRKEELIEDLTLSYNKVRQANITREMIEIASGAQAR